jgi:hypothetical protein
MKSAALHLADDGSDPRVSPESEMQRRDLRATRAQNTLGEETIRASIQFNTTESTRGPRRTRTICPIVKCYGKLELSNARRTVQPGGDDIEYPLPSECQ